MTDTNSRDFQRVQSDLAILRQATGLELPFTPGHVRALIIAALCGLPAAAVGWLTRDLLSLAVRVTIVWAVIIVPLLIYCYAKGIDLFSDRDYPFRVGMPLVFLTLVGVAFGGWLIRGQGLGVKYAAVLLAVILAVFTLTVALYDRRKRFLAVWAVCAISYPFLRYWLLLPMDVAVGLYTFVGGLAQAAICRRQLREVGQWQ